MSISILDSVQWRPFWIWAQNEDLPWVDSGGLFFLFLHTSNEIISGEKPLLTFLSNLSRSLLRLNARYGFAVIIPFLTMCGISSYSACLIHEA